MSHITPARQPSVSTPSATPRAAKPSATKKPAYGFRKTDAYVGPPAPRTQPRPRELPLDAPDKIGVRGNGPKPHMWLTRIGQTPDMAVYVTYIKGKPTYLFMMAQLGSQPVIPPTLFEGRKAVLLADRDGVIKDASFLNVPDKQQTHDAMIVSSLGALATLDKRGIGVALVTNQGGYQIGEMSFEDTLEVNVRVIQQVADNGGHIDAVLICPFTGPAGEGVIDARKPKPGMTLFAKQLASRHGLETLALVGDQRTDGAAGQAAGLPFYAATDGNGRWQAELDDAHRKGKTLPTLDTRTNRYREVENFAAAVDDILAKRSPL